MKIYDMHIHTGEGKPEQNFLLDRMAQAGVYGGGIISACPEEATDAVYKLPFDKRLENVLQWTANQDGRLIPILWVHPYETNIADKIRHAADSGIAAFKIICDSFPVYDEKCLDMVAAIEKTGKPILFHTGILWSGTATSRYNRPADWEYMLNFPDLRFATAHCGWPWHDECIAVYGKFLNYYNMQKSSEMFFDITPGTPKIYRRELLTKLFTVGYDVENNIMFGTDSLTTDYHPDWVSGWITYDNEIYRGLGLGDEILEKIYHKNFLRFLDGQEIHHRLPQMNKQ